MSVKIANSLYKQGRFQEAYELYVELQERYGTSLFEANVSLCKKSMGYKPASSETNIQDLSYLNSYFDHVYVVNLKHKVKDKLTIAQHLKKKNIYFEVFEATDGYKGEAYQKWLEYSKRPLGTFKRYKHFSDKEIKLRRSLIESAGALGYIYTYLRILDDAKNKGYERFLILEDDVLLDNQFEEKFKSFTRNINDKWKILLLGASQYGWSGIGEKESLDKGYYLPRRIDGNTTCGSFAIAFHQSVIEEMIDAASSLEAPFDHLPLGELYERHINKCFVAYPNIVIADVEESAIRGKRSQVEHSKRVKWRLENFDYPLLKPSVSIVLSSSNNLKYIESFKNEKELPFNVRIYYNSTDGLRPLHNPVVLNEAYNEIVSTESSRIVTESDYTVTLSKNYHISESDLISYIEFEAGVTNVRNDRLVSLNKNKRPVAVRGRATVIIPTYKRADNLRNAIESVVLQDYEDIELIVVSDNGNKQKLNAEVEAIVDSFRRVSSNCNIKLIKHKFNRNGSAARNTGIMNSTGEYISFLDDDDIYIQGRLSKVIKKLKSLPENIGAVYCGFLGWNSKVNNLGRYTEGDLTEEFLSLDYSRHYLHTNTATYRRHVILELNGFDESYKRHQDLEFNLRFFELYEISTYQEALVKLKPQPVTVSNRLFNSEMIELKTKFLNQFRYLIKSFPDDVQYRIYNAHVQETVKYTREAGEAIKYYAKKFDDFNIRLLISLLAEKHPSLNNELNSQLLKNEFHKNEIGFYRIIGNNHSTLQSQEQTYQNLIKVLDEEEAFENVDKYFVLNRITNSKLQKKLKDVLESRGAKYLEITYDKEIYRKIGYDLKNIPNPESWFKDFDVWNRLVMNVEIRESKNRYLINNNGARNFVLKNGKRNHEWVMPWDGNCFITKAEIEKIKADMESSGNIKYILTPMERVSNNEVVSKQSAISNAVEEPQITFRYDAVECFNEDRVYGNQPKVELFKRLGVEGKWDGWTKLSPWVDLKYSKSSEAGLFKKSGATFRLSSGKTEAVTKASQRNILRKQAIINYIDESEVVILKENLNIIGFSDSLPNSLKGFIANLDIRKMHNKLTWFVKQKKTLEAKSLMSEFVTLFNRTTNLDDKVFIFISLYSNALLEEGMKIFNFCDQTKCFIAGKPEEVYKQYDLNDLNAFISCLTSAFIANLYLLRNGQLLEAVRMKSEVSMLVYHYAINIEKIGNDKKVYSIIYLINNTYKKLYDYDLIRDLWITGVDNNKVFI
ncbi:glycosyltransferase [Psychrobacter sp. VH5]|uniref:glycosyltransferase n=1 Tax=Psychrobacter sp. VH5 TaxID=3423439 RepID=UPI003D64AEA8